MIKKVISAWKGGKKNRKMEKKEERVFELSSILSAVDEAIEKVLKERKRKEMVPYAKVLVHMREQAKEAMFEIGETLLFGVSGKEEKEKATYFIRIDCTAAVGAVEVMDLSNRMHNENEKWHKVPFRRTEDLVESLLENENLLLVMKILTGEETQLVAKIEEAKEA